MKEISLQGGAKYAHQRFSALLGSVEVAFELDFMPYLEVPSWNLTLKREGVAIATGLLLRCGCDLLAPYQLGLGALVVVGDEPTLDNLGVTSHLVWVPEDEIV